MSDATVSGQVHVIEKTKSYGQSGFRKRLVVLEQDNGRFTNYIPVDFVQDSCDTVDEMTVGDEVEIAYRLSGRKWQRDEQSDVKFFLNAEATKFTVLKKGSEGAPSSAGNAEDDAFSAEDEEVPF